MSYNGHRNWNHWNVSLWINNDESLYRRARELARRSNRNLAAETLLAELPERTPDGARFTKTAIIAAMRDI